MQLAVSSAEATLAGPAVKNFVLWRGTAPVLTFGPVQDINGNVPDVASYTGVFTVRALPATPDPVYFQRAFMPVSPTANGFLQVTLSKADTLSFLPQDYAYSLERTNVGFENLLTIGIMTVSLDIVNARP
jgi:hypothetical protein